MRSIERPSIWKLEFRQDPDKHVVLLSIVPKTEQAFNAERLGFRVAYSKATLIKEWRET